MHDAGVEIERGIDELAVLGFAEVLARLPLFLGLLKERKRSLRERPPSAIVLIDYPGLNLRVARAAKRLGIPVAYYVSPQVWAWGAGRVRTIRESVDAMIVILPFEKAFYAERGVSAHFVGHPLLDIAKPSRPRDETRRLLGASGEVPLVGLLPGSRVQEVERHLGLFLEAARRLEGSLGRPIAAAIGRAPTVPATLLRGRFGEREVRVTEETYDLMAAADILFVSSGTATLEAACIGTPMVVVYRTSPLSFALGRLLVRVPHIALANLVAEARVVPELLQSEATPEAIAREAAAVLGDDARGAAMRGEFARIRERLGEPGAAGRAAEIVLALARGDRRR